MVQQQCFYLNILLPIVYKTFTYMRSFTLFIVLLAINVNEMGSHGVHFCIFYNVCIGLRMA
jgi:hypothetical protein